MLAATPKRAATLLEQRVVVAIAAQYVAQTCCECLGYRNRFTQRLSC